MTTVRGILVEHEGKEFLVAVDAAGLPELCQRGAEGTWATLKKKGSPEGRAGHTAQEILQALGLEAPNDHTQQHIKNLVIHSVTKIISTFFASARW